MARYLYWRHGGKTVFFGRFVATLRVFAAFMAGTTRMPWRRFALANAAGVITWATLRGLLGYGLGASAPGPLGYIAFALAAVIIVIGAVVLRRHEGRWEREAVQSMTTTHGADTEGQGIEAEAA